MSNTKFKRLFEFIENPAVLTDIDVEHTVTAEHVHVAPRVRLRSAALAIWNVVDLNFTRQ